MAQKQQIDYKGEKASIVMIGAKKTVPGWKGELYVAVIQYGNKAGLKYDVVADSTSSADLDDLPEVQTFSDRGQAISHFMKLEQHKDKWK